MMRPGSGAEQYLRTQVRSSAPLELVVILYDAGLRHLTTARDAMAQGDIPTRRTALSKAMAVVHELQGALDLERGGQIAEELDRIYTWMSACLVDAIAKKDARPIEEVRRVLESLRGAWQKIAQEAPSGVRP